MNKQVSAGLYILTCVAISFALCKYVFKWTIDNQWLYGALIIPLIVLMLPLFKRR
jgi:ABC-type glycerol-3-phosphate transport system permease component